MEKIYRVYAGGAGGSGHATFLVKAQDEDKAIATIKRETFYHLGLTATLVEFNQDNFAEIESYDNPDYDG